MEESYTKLRNDMHKFLHFSTKYKNILVLISEDWSLFRLE